MVEQRLGNNKVAIVINFWWIIKGPPFTAVGAIAPDEAFCREIESK